jgi:putative hydrolase of the HAD superfamily
MGGEPTSAVLFDFSETLFAPAPEDEWIRAAATRADWVISDSDATRVANELASAFARPELAGLQLGRDLSPQSHRAALTAVFSAVESVAAGFADALYEELLEPEFWRPYPDTVTVLGRLRADGKRIGVVSNIPWDIRPRFSDSGFADLIDTFALSYEHGVEKPDPRLFDIALAELDVPPENALYVGDDPAADGGAIAVGLKVVLLPPVPAGQPRGLDFVLRLLTPLPEQYGEHVGRVDPLATP